MFQLISHYFILLVYQPFFNILVFFYWLMEVATGNPDMGIAVIFLTLVIRLLLLPLTLSSSRTEPERRKIAEEMKTLEETFGHDPIRFEKEKKKVLKVNRRILISELVNLTIQVIIAVMLWKIFAHGLAGEDLHLIYSFMPDVHLPFNLMFLGKYDLTHPHITLNLIQSSLIFIFEVVSLLNYPYKMSRDEVVRMQLVLPIVSFLVFMTLPAGKKLFVITTLCFSIVLQLVRFVLRKFKEFSQKAEEKEQTPPEAQEEKLVVE